MYTIQPLVWCQVWRNRRPQRKHWLDLGKLQLMVGSDELKSRLTPSHKLLSSFQGTTDRKHRRESCAEPNWWFGYGKRAVSESIWYGSFSLVQQKFYRVCRTLLRLDTRYSVWIRDVAPVSLHSTASEPGLTDTPFKWRTISKRMWGAGGGALGEVPKNYSPKGQLNEKNSCTPINPKKYSCYGLKNSYKEFDNEKKFLRLENSPPPPPPPHNLSNGPSLDQNYVFHFLLMTKLPVIEDNAL